VPNSRTRTAVDSVMSERNSLPVVGQLCPPFHVHGGGRDVTLGTFRGRPLVLGLFSTWEPDPDEVRGLCAELRGLGAVLLVFANGGVWCFRPDDPVEFVVDEHQTTPRVAGVPSWTVGHEAADSREFRLFLLDGEHRVRFAHVGRVESNSPTAGPLADALSAAGRFFVEEPGASRPVLSRRDWLMASLIAGMMLALPGCEKPMAKGMNVPSGPRSSPMPAAAEMEVTLIVNGTPRALRLEPRVSLLDALRERLRLTGTKKGCDHGQCGACTVLVNGRRINSCLMLAVMADGAHITTIEGLAEGERLHPLQAAFIKEDGFQCGYCTPGQIMSAAGLLRERRDLSEDTVREQMSGNLCRCGAYPNIVRAILRAHEEV
jgi:xanthine dehydrogenase YagT iron-sulfur-binding subunit